MKFKVGDKVKPNNKHITYPDLTGIVTSIGDNKLYEVKWDQDTWYATTHKWFHENNLVRNEPMKIALEPEEVNEVEIATGGWKYVVVNIQKGVAVAAFVEEGEAEDYISSAVNDWDFKVRKIKQ